MMSRYLALGLRVGLALLGIGLAVATVGAEPPAKPLPDLGDDHGYIFALAFSPDGRLLAVGGGGGYAQPDDKNRPASELTVWDVKTRKKVATLEGHTGIVGS